VKVFKTEANLLTEPEELPARLVDCQWIFTGESSSDELEVMFTTSIPDTPKKRRTISNGSTLLAFIQIENHVECKAWCCACAF
jgi:hypothetical protein